jgi:hypothetical protein
MAWVRYDDQFAANAKVSAVVVEDPGALALHLLANTWSNSQKYPGFIPAHQPAVLLCDRGLGTKWSAVLTSSGLWHERGKECERCSEYYADVPAELAGWVIHDAQDYRAPARERQTPGTPAELSAKRRQAGSKGGQATSKLREQNQQTARAKPAEAESKDSKPSSNSVSPVPEPVPEPVVASDEATTTPVASLPSSASKRGTRLPADFTVTPAMNAWAKEHVPELAGLRETEKFVNYWRAKSGKDATKVDWPATWRNWMLTAAERLPGARASPSGHSPYRNPVDPNAYSEGL